MPFEGAWTLPHLPALKRRVDALTATPDSPDLSAIDALDASGAWLLQRALAQLGHAVADAQALGLKPEFAALLGRVDRVDQRPPTAPAGFEFWTARLAAIGLALEIFAGHARHLLGFLGLFLSTLARAIREPRRLRMTALVHHMETAGFNALPIVCLLAFLVGAVVAYLGASVLKPYGGEVFTVELIAYSFMREFGVLLAAILVAGRSGSAFTAEIGAMKSHEEVDALRALGLDPIEILVLPRTLALLAMLPLVAFLATLSGILGGALIAWGALDLTPALFWARLNETMTWQHLAAGLIKAPFFALAIGLIGCLEGLKVEGSAESVGRHTTSAVVQSIFVVILLDALFAMFYLEVGF
jgi:phospholipid/cholesterol/gamma-HCH transport system permease protein